MRLALPRLVRPLGRSAVHLGNLTGGYRGNHGLWVKCATSAECYETDISVVLAVMSGQGSSID
jgi:hypothetical protein